MNKDDLLERFIDFGARSIKVANALPKSAIARHIALQLARSTTSSGANYSEACGAESSQDFAHKMQVVVKELREAYFWFRIAARAELISEKRLAAIISETNELIAICVASVKTAKANARKRTIAEDV